MAGVTKAKVNGNAALQRARASRQDRTVIGFGQVARRQKGRHYRWMDVGSLDSTRVKFYRQRWHEDGYTLCVPVDEASEYVVGVPTAEVWWCDEEVYAFHKQDRRDFARCEGRWDGKGGNEYGARSWKRIQQTRIAQMTVD